MDEIWMNKVERFWREWINGTLVKNVKASRIHTENQILKYLVSDMVQKLN